MSFEDSICDLKLKNMTTIDNECKFKLVALYSNHCISIIG